MYRIISLLALTATICAADISYVEEIVNSGIGPAKIGASRTTRNVHIKGEYQCVRDEIKGVKTTKVGTTILRLDRLSRFEIDHTSGTFTQQTLPPSSGAAKIAPRPAANDPNREVTFDTKTLPETMKIEGIPCRRVAMQMKVRYYVPGTKDVKRENRYLYQAWVATDFPGLADLERFEAQRQAKTSYPSRVAGGLSEFKEAIEDFAGLEKELQGLKGFPLESQLKVFTSTAGSEEKELFRLSRKVSSISQEVLSPAVFEVAQGLQRVGGKP